MAAGGKSTPTVMDGGHTNIEGLLYALVKFMDAGIGEDRPKKYLGKGTLTSSGTSQAFTLPAGTNLVHLQVMDDYDVHVALNEAATSSSFMYRHGGEYWIGPLDAALTSMAVIQATGAVVVYAEFYEQG